MFMTVYNMFFLSNHNFENGTQKNKHFGWFDFLFVKQLIHSRTVRLVLTSIPIERMESTQPLELRAFWGLRMWGKHIPEGSSIIPIKNRHSIGFGLNDVSKNVFIGVRGWRMGAFLLFEIPRFSDSKGQRCVQEAVKQHQGRFRYARQSWSRSEAGMARTSGRTSVFFVIFLFF